MSSFIRLPPTKNIFISVFLAKNNCSVCAPFNLISGGGEAKITLIEICLNQTYQYADDLKNGLDDD